MFRQLFRLGTREPQVLADHIEAYSELIADELKSAAAQWQHRAARHLLVYAYYMVACILAGVALMLWVMLPGATGTQLWLLASVALLPVILGLRASRALSRVVEAEAFATLRRQWAADRAMLHEVNSP